MGAALSFSSWSCLFGEVLTVLASTRAFSSAASTLRSRRFSSSDTLSSASSSSSLSSGMVVQKILVEIDEWFIQTLNFYHDVIDVASSTQLWRFNEILISSSSLTVPDRLSSLPLSNSSNSASIFSSLSLKGYVQLKYVFYSRKSPFFQSKTVCHNIRESLYKVTDQVDY